MRVASKPRTASALGRNSPFSGPLVRAIATPGGDALSILTTVRNAVLKETGGKQVPWQNHALTARFYFTPPKPADATAATAANDAADNVRICREV